MNNVRQIMPDEWPLLKQLRMEALSDSPEAFSRTLDEAMQLPDSVWQQRASGKTSFSAIAMDNNRPVGIAVGLPDPDDSTRVYLVSMWVSPVYRGTGTARSLVDFIEAWAKALGAKSIFLGVTPSNRRAEAFYRKCGFEVFDDVPPAHAAISGCDIVLMKKLNRDHNSEADS